MEALIDNIEIEKYPIYKHSRIEWLGEIPDHWKVSMLGKILTPTLTKNQPGLPLLSITRERGVILRDRDDEEENHNFIPDDLSNYKVLRKGDFGMNKMKAWQGSYGISPFTGIVSPAYYTFNIDLHIIQEFFHLAIRSKVYISFFGSASDGVRIGQWDLSRDRMKRIPFLIPPPEEQRAIANFIDRKITQIDKAIAQKENLIELLKERRQILIHKAVTRGLDINVRMKDSGVEWIGEIPEHWEIKRFKHIATNIISGPFGSSLIKDEYVKLGFKVYGQEQVIPNDFSIGDYYISESKFLRMKRYEIFVNDILISCVGTYGKIAMVPEGVEPGIINPRLIKATPETEHVVPRYLQELLLSPFCFNQFEQISRGGTMGVINIELLSSLKLIIPPIDDQVKILRRLDKIKGSISKTIEAQQKGIEKLKEYKATLINAAVTGKIKV